MTRRKSRLSVQAELEAFGEIFSSGCDYFDDLAGVVTPGRQHLEDCWWFGKTPRQRDAPCHWCDQVEQEAAAKAAWQRLGARFMTDIWPQLKSNQPQPWALQQFGLPR